MCECVCVSVCRFDSLCFICSQPASPNPSKTIKVWGEADKRDNEPDTEKERKCIFVSV